ncbi:zonular occludens toxin domain-containing protein [Alkanindiges illinoisensis]|uniref:zonular occludens toxin domain-containing protein n=1 Tax=Alkanindiges illinoisensis TaxID=197183 RepID=UPI00047C4A68|nr:zonular occludens toxin domain-containing protein [Alkanindiges illinoisensis]
MLHLITGTPGSGKTLYAVSLIIQFEKENAKNIKLNPAIFAHNDKIIRENKLEDEFQYGWNLKEQIELYPDEYDHFSILSLELRHELYYQKTMAYNSIITRIKDYNPALKLKFLKDVRTIYADINGLKVPNVLPSPDDWRTCPDGSRVFYDEIQQRETYKEERKTNDIVEALQIHRHRGFDIYGITQFPVLVHSHFRSVVGNHFHLHRGWGMPSATVYLWAYCVLGPNEPTKKAIAERSFRFSYPKDLYKYYKSATVHTHKMRIPPKFIFICIGVVLAFTYALKTLFLTDNFLTEVAGGKPQPAKTSQTVQAQQAAQVHDPLTPEQRADLEARQTSTLQNQTSTPTVEVNYDPNKPFDNQYSAGGVNRPYLSGCIQLKTKCSCYTQQGSKLDVSIADCKKVINDGMPFNPFLAQSQPAAPVQSPAQVTPNV